MAENAANIWDERDTSNCSIARSLEVVGERWTLLILRELWYGSSRFNELERILGCPRNLLAERLRKLVDHGVLTTEEYRQPGARSRRKYVVTPKGLGLVPAVLGLLQWGDQYYADPEGPAVTVTHRDCGAQMGVEVRCSSGHHIDASELEMAPGPGYRSKA